MKKFFLLRYSFDLVILGMPEPREIELDLKILQFDEKFTLKGIPGFLDLSPFNSVWEGEVETVKGEKNIDNQILLNRLVNQLNEVSEKIEYSFTCLDNDEDNSSLSVILLPLLGRLTLTGDHQTYEKYLFSYDEYQDEKNIPQRKWEMIPVEDYPMEGIPVFKK